MKNKPDDYKISLIDNADQWNNLLEKFSDANIYQTWNYSKILQNEKQLEHMAVFNGEQVVGLAQVRIKVVPILQRGVAYIFSGPLWRPNHSENKIENLIDIINVFKSRYVLEKKLVLRIRPFFFSDEIVSFDLSSDIFPELSFMRLNKKYNSILVNMNEDLEAISKNLKPRWRNYLNQSMKNDLKVVEGHEEHLFETFIQIYNQMMERKTFDEYVSPEKLKNLNDTLDSRFKLKIFVAYKGEQAVASLVGTAIGNTGIYLVGATNDLGLELRASYLLHWEVIKWMKLMGCLRYDLGGINKERNPGGYKFKTGISKHEITDLGTFEATDNLLSKFVLNLGEGILRK